jgi:16S rRNA (cytosine967-C5)-methyltransferase
MRFQSYFNTAIKIIGLYDCVIPLQYFLKQYFAQYKKHGSKDRKYITHLCYSFFRLGKAFYESDTAEKLSLAIFLCNSKTGEWNFLFKEEWLNNWSDDLNDRISFVQTKYNSFSVDDVFPFADEASISLDINAFSASLFIQPDVFIRIRPGYFNEAINRLRQHTIPFNIVDENCIELSPSINVAAILDIDKEVVIQDHSSQQVREFFKIIKSEIENQKSTINVWDCCAGSGGKSMLAYDTLQNITLTVSDVRNSIIQNLTQRFAKAGINNYKNFVADVANSKPGIQNAAYDLIICDAPCTGSGTWSRTPERLYFFDAKRIDEYALLQQKIVSHAIRSLDDGGFFLYITCSVFKKENESIVEFIQQEFQLELIKTELLKGYYKKADTMFAVLFRKLK